MALTPAQMVNQANNGSPVSWRGHILSAAGAALTPDQTATLDRMAPLSTDGVSVGDVAASFPNDWWTGSTDNPLLVVAFPPGNSDGDTAVLIGSNNPASTCTSVIGATGTGVGLYGTTFGAGGTGVRGACSAANTTGVQGLAQFAGGIGVDAYGGSTALAALRLRGGRAYAGARRARHAAGRVSGALH
jgi:hypothetical protein